MQSLFTALFIVAQLLLLFLTYQERRAAQDEAHALRTSRARILSLEAALEALTHQHRKVAGKLYQRLADQDGQITREPVEEQTDFVGHLNAPGDCENYRLAQREGPNSKAAKCECGFCEEMRRRRSALRKTLPVSHVEAVRSIEANS